MEKEDDKNTPFPETMNGEDNEDLHSTTILISRDHLGGEVQVKQHACLELLGPGVESRMVELKEEEVIIGRSPECQIQLQLHGVSRRHAHVYFRNEEYHVEDMGSTNGVYLNGIRIAKATLRNHDQITIGGVRILFTERSLQDT